MQSMTGYGRGLICEDGREMTVEVKSVNHRFPVSYTHLDVYKRQSEDNP